MKPPMEKARVPRRVRITLISALVILPFYVFSTGPVAWATNDGLHPAYLPEEVNVIYLPLAPLMKVNRINKAFYYYTTILWHGFPYGYTTP